MSHLDQILDAIGAAPVLPGALCRHRHALFDAGPTGEAPSVRDARHAQAVELCLRCPSLERCRTWYASLPRRRRPDGVVAGQVRAPSRPGRPKATA